VDHSRFPYQQSSCKKSTLWLWGIGTEGQLGQDDRISRSSPVQVPGSGWCDIDFGNRFTLGVKSDNTLWSWGQNTAGKLGHNNTGVNRSTPVQIPGNTWCKVATGLEASYAVKTDGSLWGWGANTEGQLGQNDTNNRSSPVQIPGNNWVSVEGHADSAYAIKSDGTLWSWGSNTAGQLGQNDIINRSSPVQIPGTSWSCISASGPFSAGPFVVGLKTDGTMWAWGCNNFGQLGQSNTSNRSSPVQIPGNDWSKVAAGVEFSIAIKSNNTLWAWGRNHLGQLGSGNTSNRSSPIQIPGTSWSDVGAHCSSGAIKSDGTLWAWGAGNNGLLGQNDVDSRSSPIQIPGSGWSYLKAGPLHVGALKGNNSLNNTWNGLPNVFGNDGNYAKATVISTDQNLNDEIYLNDFKFCMGQKSRIIEANLTTRMAVFDGSVYGASDNGWSSIHFIKNDEILTSDLGNVLNNSSFSNFQDRSVVIQNPPLTPTLVTSNTFGVKLKALSASGNANIWVDSIKLTLTTENSGNNISQPPAINSWNNLTDII
jgi:alpha-tubulin suppressor-like RCC1 family protein